MICNENEDIKVDFGNSFITDTKIIGRRTCRYHRKGNVRLDTSLEIFEYETELLIVDMDGKYIKETSEVVICYNYHL